MSNLPAAPEPSKTRDQAGLRLLGRRPILDAELNTFGHELRFCNGHEDSFTGVPDEFTSEVIDSLLTSVSGAISSSGKIFVSCTRSALLQGLVTLLPVGSTVLEIPESVEVDDEILEACKELRELGYELALEDYSPHADTDRLLPLTSYLKLDSRTFDLTKLPDAPQYRGSGTVLIAKNLETQEEFASARSAGYRYFEGHFFARPTLLERRELPPNKAIYLQLICAISRLPVDRTEVEKLLMAEASLCFRLLRLVNSTGMGIRNPIRTVRQAMLMIGDDELRKLIMVSGAAALASDVKASEELLLMGQYRARFCELLAAPAGQAPGEQYLIGLLSVLEALLLLPVSQVVEMLPLRTEAKAALEGDRGPVAIPLRLLEAYERQEVELCRQLRTRINISQEQVEYFYLAALRWGAQQSAAMKT